MTTSQWFAFFRRHAGKKIFALSDLRQMTGIPDRVLQVELSRLTSRGMVQRLAAGWYANPFNLPSPEEAVMALRFPCYLSMEYALFKHGVLSQTVFTITVVTPRLPRTFTVLGAVVECHQITRRLFWGYEVHAGINLALPEKALLDLVYVRYLRGRFGREDILSLIDDMYLEDLDRERLSGYMQGFGLPSRGRLREVLEAAGLL